MPTTAYGDLLHSQPRLTTSPIDDAGIVSTNYAVNLFNCRWMWLALILWTKNVPTDNRREHGLAAIQFTAAKNEIWGWRYATATLIFRRSRMYEAHLRLTYGKWEICMCTAPSFGYHTNSEKNENLQYRECAPLPRPHPWLGAYMARPIAWLHCMPLFISTCGALLF